MCMPECSTKKYDSLSELNILLDTHFRHNVCLTFLLDGYSVGMRRYSNISTQYGYVGPRYVSCTTAIYRDTILTFVIRRSHCAFTVVLVFNMFKILFLKNFHFLSLSSHYFTCKYM